MHPVEVDGPTLDPHVHCQTWSAGVNQHLSSTATVCRHKRLMSLPMPYSLSGRRSPDVGSVNRDAENTHTHLSSTWNLDGAVISF